MTVHPNHERIREELRDHPTRTIANEGCSGPSSGKPSKSVHVSVDGAMCVIKMYDCKRNLKKNANMFIQALKGDSKQDENWRG